MTLHEVTRAGALALLVVLITGFSPDQPEKPCITCHEDVLEGGVEHAPVADGKCSVCHDAVDRTLALPEKELCFSCHADMIAEKDAFTHDFFADGKCDICHLTHSSNEPHLLLIDTIKICESCHPDQRGGRSHPVGGGAMDPVTGGELTCVSTCHEPHSSDQKFMLRKFTGRELCESCHPDKF